MSISSFKDIHILWRRTSFASSSARLELKEIMFFHLNPHIEIETWLILPVAYACLKD